MFGRFYRQVDTLGIVRVSADAAHPELADSFDRLRHNQGVIREIDPYRPLFERPFDHSLTLTVRPGWKDTALIPTGSTIDLLVEMSNPGAWMLHCHISEHLGAGMMMTLTVYQDEGR